MAVLRDSCGPFAGWLAFFLRSLRHEIRLCNLTRGPVRRSASGTAPAIFLHSADRTRGSIRVSVRMAKKFIIEPHFRLHEWVAEEKGYFKAEGLDYEFLELVQSTDGQNHIKPD